MSESGASQGPQVGVQKGYVSLKGPFDFRQQYTESSFNFALLDCHILSNFTIFDFARIPVVRIVPHKKFIYNQSDLENLAVLTIKR